jgi:hypothetical protein
MGEVLLIWKQEFRDFRFRALETELLALPERLLLSGWQRPDLNLRGARVGFSV